jgi:hypothetical protein
MVRMALRPPSEFFGKELSVNETDYEEESGAGPPIDNV